MSDTTTTITQEERAEWLKEAQPKSVSHYEPIDFEMDKRIRRLLTALEAAEKALLKEEVYSEELESQLQDADGEYNANWAVQAISDVARLVGVYEQCSETGDGIGAAVIEAVQDLKSEKDAADDNGDRLQKMVEWLADHLYTAVSCPRGDLELQCPFGTQPSAEDCENHHWLKCWKEAARRAVEGDTVMKTGIELIAAERARHQELGWTAEHDDQHAPEELELAAACYAMPESFRLYGYVQQTGATPHLWPLADKYWKPSTRERDLEKAGALLAAALDLRMRRAVGCGR